MTKAEFIVWIKNVARTQAALTTRADTEKVYDQLTVQAFATGYKHGWTDAVDIAEGHLARLHDNTHDRALVRARYHNIGDAND